MASLTPKDMSRLGREFLEAALIQPEQLSPSVLSPYATKSSLDALAPVARSGDYSDLSGVPAIPSTPGDVGAASAEQGAKADSAVQPGDLGSAAFAQVNAFASAEQGLKADTALQPSAIPAYSFRLLAKRKVDEADFDLVDSVYELKFDSDGRLVSSKVVP